MIHSLLRRTVRSSVCASALLSIGASYAPQMRCPAKRAVQERHPGRAARSRAQAARRRAVRILDTAKARTSASSSSRRGCRIRGAWRFCPTAACWSPSAQGGSASSATACSIRSRSPAVRRRSSAGESGLPGAVHGSWTSRSIRNSRRTSSSISPTRSRSATSDDACAVARMTVDGQGIDRRPRHLRRRRQRRQRVAHRVRPRRHAVHRRPAAATRRIRTVTRGKVLRLSDDGSVPADNPFVGTGRLQAGDLFARPSQLARAGDPSGRPARCGRTRTVRTAATRSTSSSRAATTAGRSSATAAPIRARGSRSCRRTKASSRRSSTGVPSIAVSGHGVLHRRRAAEVEGRRLRRRAAHGRDSRHRAPRTRSCSTRRWRSCAASRCCVELRQRIRDVRQGPDGLLYLLTDEKQGAVLRIEPR